MVNWTPIGIVLLISGILAIIGAGIAYYLYRNRPNQSKWWIWLIGGLGLLAVILGIIALVVGNRPTVGVVSAAPAENVVLLPDETTFSPDVTITTPVTTGYRTFTRTV